MGEMGAYVGSADGFTLGADEQVDRSEVREGVVFRIDRKLAPTGSGHLIDAKTDLPQRRSYNTLGIWSLRE